MLLVDPVVWNYSGRGDLPLVSAVDLLVGTTLYGEDILI